MLTSGDIAGMRATLNTLHPDTAAIRRKSVTISGGEEVVTWNTLASNVPCRLTHRGVRDSEGEDGGAEGGRMSEETTHIVTLAAKTDIEEADEITVNGDRYEVLIVRKRGAWELSRRVEVKEAVSIYVEELSGSGEPSSSGSGSGSGSGS